MPEFIVEITPGCWLAKWQGDPGRTLLKESAKRYKSEFAAHCALLRAKRVFPRRDYSAAKVYAA